MYIVQKVPSHHPGMYRFRMSNQQGNQERNYDHAYIREGLKTSDYNSVEIG